MCAVVCVFEFKQAGIFFSFFFFFFVRALSGKMYTFLLSPLSRKMSRFYYSKMTSSANMADPLPALHQSQPTIHYMSAMRHTNWLYYYYQSLKFSIISIETPDYKCKFLIKSHSACLRETTINNNIVYEPVAKFN